MNRNIFKCTVSVLAALAMTSLLNSCYDDTDVKNSLEDLTDRVEALEAFCKDVQSEIASIQEIIDKLESDVTVDNIVDNGDGYTINFSDGSSITINHGEDGEDGLTPPSITVSEDDGVYYWAYENADGEIEFILDDDGNRIPVTGTAPQVRINSKTGNWEISTDGGRTWEDTGMPSSGGSGDGMITGVTEDDNYVYFTFRDGTEIAIPKTTKLNFFFDTEDEVLYFDAGESRTVAYRMSGVEDMVITKPGGWKASIEAEGFVITAPVAENTYAETEGEVSVLVTAVNGQSLIAKIGVEIGDGPEPVEVPVLTLTSESEVSLPKDGGDVSITYTVENPVEDGVISAKSDASWLTFDTATPGRVLVTASANADDATRTAVVTVVYTYDGDKTMSFNVTVTQSMYDYEFDLPYLTGSYYGDDYSVNDGEMMYQLYLTNNEVQWQYGGAYYWISILSGEPSDMNAIAPAVGTYNMSPSAGSDIAGMNTIVKSTKYTVAYVYPDASVGGMYYSAFFSWGELELTYENGEYHLDAVLTDTRNNTHHITYTGPIVCANYAQPDPDEPDEPENPDAISLLTEDLTINWTSARLVSGYYWGNGEYRFELMNSDGYSQDPKVKIQLYTEGSEIVVPTGTFEINNTAEANTVLVGSLTESMFGGTSLAGSWVYPVTGSAYSGNAAPLTTGTVTITDNGNGSYTMVVDAEDDANNTIKVTAPFTATPNSFIDLGGY